LPAAGCQLPVKSRSHAAARFLLLIKQRKNVFQDQAALVADYPFTAIDHVQLAMPPGGEESARGFYRDLLGMIEISKPEELAKRGGCWFESGGVQIHLGIEADFRPARKAHPALRCRNYDDLTAHLRAAGVETGEDNSIPGVRRFHISDPFGNRIELISS
jgi:catechol 2,3-dioxygenase-like lactoylglutathione lyase family enzyme